VDLELKARWQPVFEHPLDDLAWFEAPEDRTEKDRPDALRKLVTFDLFAGPLVILPRSDGKLHLITMVEKCDIRVEIPSDFPA
jgi:hypothetical protein